MVAYFDTFVEQNLYFASSDLFVNETKKLVFIEINFVVQQSTSSLVL